MIDAGVYALTIRLDHAADLRYAGRTARFPAGWYVYVGRAMKNLRARIARHVGHDAGKAIRWNIDALRAAGRAADVQVRPARRPEDECRLAAEVRRWPGAVAVPAFGAADCRCEGHLFRFPRRPGTSILAGGVLRRIDAMVDALRACHPGAIPAPEDPFRTLAGCILSLRTQDPVTDAATHRLFARWPGARDLAAADPGEIAPVIYPVGMYRVKARTLVEIARRVVDEHGGAVPDAFDALLALPGVGRKTANLVRSFAFRLPALCVDTHVHRIVNRWGLCATASPDETEQELRRILPERHWIDLNPLLVRHGQSICRPQRPRCARCPLQEHCRFDVVSAVRPGYRPEPASPSITPAATAAPSSARRRSPKA